MQEEISPPAAVSATQRVWAREWRRVVRSVRRERREGGGKADMVGWRVEAMASARAHETCASKWEWE